MDPAFFDDLQRTLAAKGPAAAIDELCTTLRERRELHSLFYALLLKKRHELGVCPVPTGPAEELPADSHAPYETAIREAGRLVGQLYLDQGDIPHAWAYYRMLGEPEPVARALDAVQPAEGEDVQALVEIGYYHGVNPRRGFDLMLERFGICNSITTLSSGEFPHGRDVHEYCIHRLVRALYSELAERLAADIERREGTAPKERSVRTLLTGRDSLFEDDVYHIDMSHLSAVVQMSMHLSPGEELNLSRELCLYGSKLSPRYQSPGEPPFQNQYHDYAVYLDILAGERVEEGLAHFRAKADAANPEEEGTGAAEVLVNLLLRLDRPAEALAIARKHLSNTDGRRLNCPNLTELCQRANDYRSLAAAAREQGDPVHYLAGLLAAGEKGKT